MPVHAHVPVDFFTPISATLIWDGSGEPTLPRQLRPAGKSHEEGEALIKGAGQLLGTPMEVTCEIAGRACYDSLGRGRTSAGYHQHILEVKHLSTVEHGYFTVSFNTREPDFTPMLALAFANRPNVWVRQEQPYVLRATVNLRHVLEWSDWKPQLFVDPLISDSIGYALRRIAHQYAPQIVSQIPLDDEIEDKLLRNGIWFRPTPVAASTPEERWATLLLTGSRGFSHELVRHGDFTAISQRSTRYVDESESPWVKHPLEVAHDDAAYAGTPYSRSVGFGEGVDLARERYCDVVDKVEPWLISKGVDKVSARKQARGAARGYLGNALYTEVVFSASVAQWRRMLLQRLNAAADAEIREVFAQALIELKRSSHADFFEGWNTIPSPDGIGVVLDTASLPKLA